MTPVCTVYVQYRFRGLHFWAKAPEPVAFLRAYHRHEFHVKVTAATGLNNEREVEFFILQKHLKEAIENLSPDKDRQGALLLKEMSCEAMAVSIGVGLIADGYQIISVEVAEDGENGAVVRWS